MIKWDLLNAEDIEVRIGGKIKETNNVTMLLYQDSRCTARNLDKQFGQFGWQIDYKVVGDQIYGTLSIWDDTKQQWVSKSDTGDKSNISEDKGQSSDILKRCAVRWGFGTELYTAPRIVVPDDGYGNSGYKVSQISYNENREIVNLVIVNRFDKEVFNWSINAPATTNTIPTKEVPKTPVNTPKEDNIAALKQQLKEFVIAQHTLENEEQIKKFHSYYLNIINTKGWKGTMNLNKLFENWMGRAYS